MDDKIQSLNLGNTLSFLDQLRQDWSPESGINPRNYRLSSCYGIEANMQLSVDDKVYNINFLGTNHARKLGTHNSMDTNNIADSERENIERFMSKVPNKSTFLIEDGTGENGNTKNNIVHYLRDVASTLDLDDKLDSCFAYGTLGELGDVADQALLKGMDVENMDLFRNHGAIEYLVERFGLSEAEDYLKRGLDLELPSFGVRNKLVKDILESILTKEGYEKARISDFQDGKVGVDFDDFESDDERESYMTQRILERLKDNDNLYVAAHSIHITQILKRLAKMGEVISFSANLSFSPEKDAELSALMSELIS